MQIVGLDLETTGTNPHADKITAAGLSYKNGDIVHTDVYDFYYENEKNDFIEKIKALNKGAVTFIIHNSKFDLGFLRTNFNITLNNVWCTMLASQIINGGINSVKHSYKAVVEQAAFRQYPSVIANGVSLAPNRWFYKNKPTIDKENTDEDGIAIREGFDGKAPLNAAQIEYLKKDVLYLPYVYEQQTALMNHIHEKTGGNLIQVAKLENKLTKALLRMELQGLYVCEDTLNKLNNDWEKQERVLENSMKEELIDLAKTHRYLCSYRTTATNKKIPPLVVYSEIDNRYYLNMNFNSVHDIKELFQRAGIVVETNKDGKSPLDVSVLTKFLQERKDSVIHKFVSLLVTYKKLKKKSSMYGKQFIETLEKDINGHTITRTSYSQIANTGRLRSSGINYRKKVKIPKKLTLLQRLPTIDTLFEKNVKNHYYVPENEQYDIVERKVKVGLNIQNVPKGEIRDIFIAPPNYVFKSRDASAIEGRFAADLSQDALLCASYLDETVDPHCQLGTDTYKLVFKDKNFKLLNTSDTVEYNGHTFVHNKLRTLQKNLLYGFFYGATANRFHDVLKSVLVKVYDTDAARINVCKQIHKVMGDNMPSLRDMLKKYSNQALEDGYVIGNQLGRIRWFHESKGYVAGEAANMPIQSLNAECMKIFLVQLDLFFSKFNLFITQNGFDTNKYIVDKYENIVKPCFIVNTVHDEVNYNIHTDFSDILEPHIDALFKASFSTFMRKSKASEKVKFVYEYKGKTFEYEYVVHHTIIPILSTLNEGTKWIH